MNEKELFKALKATLDDVSWGDITPNVASRIVESIEPYIVRYCEQEYAPVNNMDSYHANQVLVVDARNEMHRQFKEAYLRETADMHETMSWMKDKIEQLEC